MELNEGGRRGPFGVAENLGSGVLKHRASARQTVAGSALPRYCIPGMQHEKLHPSPFLDLEARGSAHLHQLKLFSQSITGLVSAASPPIACISTDQVGVHAIRRLRHGRRGEAAYRRGGVCKVPSGKCTSNQDAD